MAERKNLLPMSRPEQNINISGIEGSDNPYSRDYSELPSEIREFAVPHPAEGPNTHELAVEGSDLKMPVSLHFKGSNFYITGIELKTNTGAIIWGNVSDDAVKIKHIEVAKKLKRTGLSRALLLDLEDQLKREDIKNFYAAFSNPDTINFFMKMDIKLSPLPVYLES